MAVRPIPRPKVPKLGRPSGKFTQHRRLDLLREKLAAHGAGLSLEELAGMLRVTTRSVRRYLRELALVTELESVPPRPGGAHLWRIKPSERGRTVTLRRTQAYALLAVRRVFDVLKGSALYDEIDVAMRQIEEIARRPFVRASVRGEVGIEARLEERFAFAPPLARAYGNRSEEIDALFQALAELRPLRCRYREPSGRTSDLEVHPYALILDGGALTCVACDVARGAVRALSFDRLSQLTPEPDRTFELPPDFHVDEWLHGSFGVGSAPRPIRVLVEFEPRAAELVRSRRVHASQKVAVAADGRVRVSLTLPESSEVLAGLKSWVLGFGAAARVLEPREVADDIALELRRAADRYRA